MYYSPGWQESQHFLKNFFEKIAKILKICDKTKQKSKYFLRFFGETRQKPDRIFLENHKKRKKSMQNGEKSIHQKAAEGPRRAENGAIATCAPAGGGKSRPNLAARRSNP